jgi:hypothetical protein
MKIYVITNRQGRIVGSARAGRRGGSTSDAPRMGRPSALAGQKVHEIELPQNLEEVVSPAELHQALQKLVSPSRRSTSRRPTRVPVAKTTQRRPPGR